LYEEKLAGMGKARSERERSRQVEGRGIPVDSFADCIKLHDDIKPLPEMCKTTYETIQTLYKIELETYRSSNQYTRVMSKQNDFLLFVPDLTAFPFVTFKIIR
jgi:hypothetical protein